MRKIRPVVAEMFKFYVWGKSDQWLLRYSSFNIRGHFEFFNFGLVPKIKFRIWSVLAEILNYDILRFSSSGYRLQFIWWRLDQWLLRYSTFNILRSSSVGGCLPFIDFILVWSPWLKFKIWGKSDQWLLRYSTFYNLRLYYIGGHLPLDVLFISCIFEFGLVSWA